jgi:DNA repair exonuclease SbcCD ATPase subunit
LTDALSPSFSTTVLPRPGTSLLKSPHPAPIISLKEVHSMSEDRTQQLPDDGVRLLLARFDLLDTRLTELEDKVDRRLQETRPIWEQVLDRLTKVETRFGKVEDEVFWLGRNFRNWTRDVLKLQEKYEDLEERIGHTGSEPSS